jgi:hypothetical protein
VQRFCSSCNYPLIAEAAIEQIKEAEKTKSEFEEMKKQFNELKRNQFEMMNAFVHDKRHAIPDDKGGYKFGPPVFEELLFKYRHEYEQQDQQQQKKQDSSNKFNNKKQQI